MEVVKELIEFVKMKEGPEAATSYVNSVNEKGASALHYAAEVVDVEKNALEANREVVKLLLQNGIDVTLATKAVNEITYVQYLKGSADSIF
jgi:ankyrin repeat protein